MELENTRDLIAYTLQEWRPTEQYGKDVIATQRNPAGAVVKCQHHSKRFLVPVAFSMRHGLPHFFRSSDIDSTVINRVQDPFDLNQVAQRYKDVSTMVKSLDHRRSMGWGIYILMEPITVAAKMCHGTLYPTLASPDGKWSALHFEPWLRIFASTAFNSSIVNDENLKLESLIMIQILTLVSEVTNQELPLTPRDGNIHCDTAQWNTIAAPRNH
ncbi:hypothetical protein SLEP1_g40569 [Rubroshorea leprosula]|uniref:Uncharacterized protein n=1 Tax=Rubroshorea leprosula TaxID=152421 RepID=A0AAV5L3T8_9ROSI|nr:hypothetical protein SLEP1_g40569 [Rubroshorea leprosula]